MSLPGTSILIPVRFFSLVLAVGVILLAGASAQVDYLTDDGDRDENFKLGKDFDVLLLNKFTVASGGELLDSISVNWTQIDNGVAASVVIFDDPTDDGDYSDIEFVFEQAVVTADADDKKSNTFTKYAIPETNVFGEFYVGVLLQNIKKNQKPVGYDTTATLPPFSSVVFANLGNLKKTGDIDLLDLYGTTTEHGWLEDYAKDEGEPAALMVRATGVPFVIPEPSRALLLVLGVVMAAVRRDRRFS